MMLRKFAALTGSNVVFVCFEASCLSGLFLRVFAFAFVLAFAFFSSNERNSLGSGIIVVDVDVDVDVGGGGGGRDESLSPFLLDMLIGCQSIVWFVFGGIVFGGIVFGGLFFGFRLDRSTDNASLMVSFELWTSAFRGTTVDVLEDEEDEDEDEEEEDEDEEEGEGIL